MRTFRFVFLFFLLTFAKSAMAQQATVSAPQATALLQQSLASLSGGHTLTDVTLSGTAQRKAGSDDESGTTVLKALAAGASRVDLTLTSGSRTEIINSTSAPPVGSWSGPDGVSHPIAYHNLLTAPAWFFPVYPIATGLSAGYVAAYVGHETRNGQAVEHLTVSQVPPITPALGTPSFAHLSQVDFFLNSTTFLPAVITFNVHADTNALLDIPVEIDFSSYTVVSGAQVPFHIQKFINNSLALDLQLQNAIFNSGLTASSFAVGAGL